jgi:hypothetical protein
VCLPFKALRAPGVKGGARPEGCPNGAVGAGSHPRAALRSHGVVRIGQRWPPVLRVRCTSSSLPTLFVAVALSRRSES